MISSGILLVTNQSWEYHERNTVIQYKGTTLGRFIRKKDEKTMDYGDTSGDVQGLTNKKMWL